MTKSIEKTEELPLADPVAVPQKRGVRFQAAVALIVSWLSIIQGYAIAYTAPADVSMARDLKLTENQITWITSLLPIGALLGCITGGFLLEKLGRKRTLLFTDLVFLLAWLINYFAYDYSLMYISRIFVGLGVGITSLALPVYLTETIFSNIRGRLGLFPTGFGNFGILLCYCLGNFMEWKGLASVGFFLSVPFLIGFWFIPETPYWYILKKDNEKARIALQWLRGDSNIDKELDYIYKTNSKKHIIKDFLTKPHPKATLIVLGLMFFQQFSGINAIIFYSTKIFRESGSKLGKLDPTICTTIIGVVNFLTSLLATFLVDKMGRKQLLYFSAFVMAFSLCCLGFYFYFLNIFKWDMSMFTWMPLTTFMLYVLAFSFGFGPVPWLMMGEILPAVIRGPAASLCSTFNWACTFIVTKTYPIIDHSIGVHWAFGIFFLTMCYSLIFIKFLVPETKKKTLEEIETILCEDIIPK